MSAMSKRLTAILATGIVLIGTALFFLFVCFVHPIGHGPAGPDIPRELFSSPWTGRPVLLVDIGDSVTAGFGARRGYSYFDLKDPHYWYFVNLEDPNERGYDALCRLFLIEMAKSASQLK